MKAVIYTRVSKDEQVRGGQSLDNQLQLCLNYCNYRGFDVVGTYRDEGISGFKKALRPEYTAMLQFVEDGGADHVVVYALPRLSRKSFELMRLFEYFRDKGVTLHSLNENLDASTATGRFFMRFMALQAEFESDLMSDRVRSVFAHKRSKNEVLGNIPYGFYRDGKNLIPHNDELKVVAMIKSMWETCTTRDIAKNLNDACIITRSGKKWNHGLVWGVQRNIKNGIYDGFLKMPESLTL